MQPPNQQPPQYPQQGQPQQGYPQQGQPQQGQPQQGQPQQGHQQQGQAQQGHPAQGQGQPQAAAPTAQGGTAQLYEGGRRHSASWWAYTKWVLVMILGSTVGALLMNIEFFSTWPLWLLGFIGLPGIFYAYIQHISTKFRITTKRVEWERGVIRKQVDSLELWRVLDVRYSQTIIDRMLGNATITLVGTDQTDPELNLHGLPKHRELFEKLRDCVEAARRSGRPLEMVGEGFVDGGGYG